MSKGGFFDTDELPAGGTGCGYTCLLRDGCESPAMPPSGEGEKDVLFVAEAPGADEDRKNTQLVGKIGREFREILEEELDFDLDREARKTNGVRCRPPKNRTPTPEEIAACRSHIWEEIREHRPRVIIPLGGVALESLIGDRWKKDLGGISRWRGFRIPDHRAGAWICPTWHPSYVARSRNDKKGSAVEPLFIDDLRQALRNREQSLPSPVLESDVRVEKDPDRAARALRRLPDGIYAVDFETTGLRPHNDGHRIVCAAVSNGRETLSFPVEGRAERFLAQFMGDEGKKKVAQHIQFEDMWAGVRLGTRVRGWVWDTMLAGHILDNRPGVTGLKFQAFVRLGLVGYDEDVGPFLQAKGKSANDFNRIDKADPDKVLRYCGMDALAEFRLFEQQEVELRANDIPI